MNFYWHCYQIPDKKWWNNGMIRPGVNVKTGSKIDVCKLIVIIPWSSIQSPIVVYHFLLMQCFPSTSSYKLPEKSLIRKSNIGYEVNFLRWIWDTQISRRKAFLILTILTSQIQICLREINMVLARIYKRKNFCYFLSPQYFILSILFLLCHSF